MKSGDWICETCKFENFRSRSSCFKCKHAKASLSTTSSSQLSSSQSSSTQSSSTQSSSSTTSFVLNDWTCIKCANVNFKKRVFCNKCGCTKDGKPTPPSEWICHTCLTFNDKYTLICPCNQPYEHQTTPGITWEMEKKRDIVVRIYRNLGIDIDLDNLPGSFGRSSATDILRRNYINQDMLKRGYQLILEGKDPDTGHHESCCCNDCCLLD